MDEIVSRRTVRISDTLVADSGGLLPSGDGPRKQKELSCGRRRSRDGRERGLPRE